jgi:hypothetical protein
MRQEVNAACIGEKSNGHMILVRKAKKKRKVLKI